MRVVVKIGTSSLTAASGNLNLDAIAKLSSELADVRQAGHEVVLVTSAAITAGLPALGFVNQRPRDTLTLQAAAAVGQSRLLRAYDDAFGQHALVGGQILLSPNDFFARKAYVHARDTLARLLALGVIPIVNENDAVADDEIRFGDNDRLAALVAHALNAHVLILLTDTAGLFTADPRFDETASLVEEIVEIDRELEAAAGASGSDRGSGGMASKLAAARMAAWTGVRTVIASASRTGVVMGAVAGEKGIGTVVQPRTQGISARKLWIAFALPASGRLFVDSGAYKALVDHGGSLLSAGIKSVSGSFEADSGVEIISETGEVLAKGVCRYSAAELQTSIGRRLPSEVVHRDDLVILV